MFSLLNIQISLKTLVDWILVILIVLGILIITIPKNKINKSNVIIKYKNIIMGLFIVILGSIIAILLIPKGWHSFLGSLLGAIIALGGTFLVVKSSEDNTSKQIRAQYHNSHISNTKRWDLKRIYSYRDMISKYCDSIESYSVKVHSLHLRTINYSWFINKNTKYSDIGIHVIDVIDKMISLENDIDTINILIMNVYKKYIALKANFNKHNKNNELGNFKDKTINEKGIENDFSNMHDSLEKNQKSLNSLLDLSSGKPNKDSDSKVMRNVGFNIANVATSLHTVSVEFRDIL